MGEGTDPPTINPLSPGQRGVNFIIFHNALKIRRSLIYLIEEAKEPPKIKRRRNNMIGVGQQAPDFELASHLGGSKFTLSQFKGQKNVMLVFYPLDWTPT